MEFDLSEPARDSGMKHRPNCYKAYKNASWDRQYSAQEEKLSKLVYLDAAHTCGAAYSGVCVN